jgi:hypothetical protein
LQTALWPLDPVAGTYTIKVTGDPGQSLTRTIAVPEGRSPSVFVFPSPSNWTPPN